MKTSDDWRCKLSSSADGYRNMAIDDGKSKCRVVAAPASTRNIHLRPGMRIWLLIAIACSVAADETSGKPEGTACVNKKHRKVTASALPSR
jgi:hypothetical protein